MNLLVIDAHGGGMGKQLIAAIRAEFPTLPITAVGTNSTATATMLRAGADRAATGENAVLVCSKRSDIIIGPIGIVVADSLLGEITPKIAVAVGRSSADRILLPTNQCDVWVPGLRSQSMAELIQEALVLLRNCLQKRGWEEEPQRTAPREPQLSQKGENPS